MACGLFFSNQLLFWFLVVGTLINIFVVMFASSRLEREYERTNMVHIIKDSLIERYGLMTMIALGEIISSLYDFSKTPINWNRFIQFTLCIILVALLAAVYYQVLGELHIQLNSSIATSLTG
ncbi:low temperature requirement protein A [Lactobacillus amylovorus]|nr:low temperature requirement protein A [Lactobacillus amylovorus]MDB6242638.1 low temperature requirement protein A [Lactobacillus amylovorus]MDB6244046.1 low temperature requirement protein A [Lactobacillus amylovorus]